LEKDEEDQLERSSENEVLNTVKKERNILHSIQRRKANWIGHIWSGNCLLKRVIERMIKDSIKVMGRRGRRRNQLLDELNLLALEFYI
jgi:hypothetical protein